MADNNIGTLFHFTKNYSTLKKILREGFRITYCKESFQDFCLGIPMVSFCDIPLSRTDQHKKAYGNFVIGLDKEKLLATKQLTYLNPVIYCHSEILADSLSSYKKDFESLVREIGQMVQKTEYPNVQIVTNGEVGKVLGMQARSQTIKQRSNSILGFTKPYEGINKKGKKIIYYNEREWRFVIPEGTVIDEKECHWLNEDEYKQWRGDYSRPKKLFNTILPLDADYIAHLIVEREASIPSLIRYIENLDYLLGQPFKKEQKKVLTSRIISFEKIRKDF